MSPEGRYHRQELLFGDEGQRRIAAETIGVIGLGGVGSHAVQQLAYLGTTRFVLVDDDVVTLTNLNRLIGATQADVDTGRPKVEVARRLVESIQPLATLRQVCDSAVSDDAFRLLKQADFIFVCVDDDAIRSVMNEFCQAYERPYVDVATDIDPSSQTFGGRMLLADGRVCVSCRDLLDQTAIRDALASDAQRKEELRIYGLRLGALGSTGPSVVSLNGILASVAVTEYLMWSTGIRDPYLHIEYKGMMGVMTRDREMPHADCYYCRHLRGTGDAADVERYIRAGLGERWKVVRR